MTNPPFGGIEEDGIEINFPAQFRTKETADLFLVLMMYLLKDRGRVGMALPNGVFEPYTGIKTNLLFFEKGDPTKEIWFFEHPLPQGYKKYTKTKPIRHEEFELEKKWWHKREENEFAWKVPVEEIRDKGYNLDLKNPNVEAVDYGDPEKILVLYNKHITELEKQRNLLKEELLTALKR